MENSKKDSVVRGRIPSRDANLNVSKSKRSVLKRAWGWIWENFPATFCCVVVCLVLWLIMSLAYNSAGDLSALRNALNGGHDSRVDALNVCLDNGGDVEIKSDGQWSCHFKNETLRGEKDGEEL